MSHLYIYYLQLTGGSDNIMYSTNLSLTNNIISCFHPFFYNKSHELAFQ